MEKQNQYVYYTYTIKRFKELAYEIIGSNKSEICKAGRQARRLEAQAEVDVSAVRQNSFFSRKISVFVLKDIN